MSRFAVLAIVALFAAMAVVPASASGCDCDCKNLKAQIKLLQASLAAKTAELAVKSAALDTCSAALAVKTTALGVCTAALDVKTTELATCVDTLQETVDECAFDLAACVTDCNESLVGYNAAIKASADEDLPTFTFDPSAQTHQD